MKRLGAQIRRQGMTLIEALMAVIIFATASMLVASFVVYGYRSHLETTEEALATDRINLNIQRMTEELRRMRAGENGAFALESALEQEVIFYADTDGDGATEKIAYFLEDGELFRGVTPPGGDPAQYQAGDEEIKRIVREVSNNDETPVFTYWGHDDNEELVELASPPELTEIVLIGVELRTPVKHKEDKERIISSKVYLRNL